MKPVAAPERTTVLAIGIERYGDLGGAWDLRGAGSQATRFARWALSCGVPKEEIFLGCTWANGAEAVDPARQLGVQPAGTHGDELLRTLERLSSRSGDLLLVYWCGHGAVSKMSDRRLFTSTARPTNRSNIGVDELRAHIGSPAAGGAGFARQVLFIDACANLAEDGPLPPSGWEGPPVHPREQEVYFSTDVGYVSAYDPISRTAGYSTAVLTWLEKHGPDSFPPDLSRLTKDVRKSLRSRARTYTGMAVQLYVRQWDGNERADEYRAGDFSLEAAQVGALAQEVGATAEKFPELFLGQRLEPRAAFAAGHGDMFLRSIEALASSSSQQGAALRLRDSFDRHHWVATPLHVIHHIDLHVLRAAYQHAVSPASDVPVVTGLLQTLFDAASRGPRFEPSSPLYRLIARLDHVTRRPLRPWLEQELGGDDAERLLAATAPDTDPMRSAIVFDFSSVETATLTPVVVPIHIWRGTPDFGVGTWAAPSEATCAANVGALRTMVETELRRCLQGGGISGELTTVGFVLSRRQFDWHPEKWQVDPWDVRGAEELAAQFPVTIHFAERFTKSVVEPWQTRLARIRDRLSDGVPEVEWLLPGHSLKPVDEAVASCVAFDYAPKSGGHPRDDPFLAALVQGAPYIIWPGRDPIDRAEMRAVFTQLVQRGLAGLPERLHRERGTLLAAGDSARLIWDDEGRIPPGLFAYSQEVT